LKRQKSSPGGFAKEKELNERIGGARAKESVTGQINTPVYTVGMYRVGGEKKNAREEKDH